MLLYKDQKQIKKKKHILHLTEHREDVDILEMTVSWDGSPGARLR